jgi:hypothetical protein
LKLLCEDDSLEVGDFVLDRFLPGRGSPVCFVGRVEVKTSRALFNIKYMRKKDNSWTFYFPVKDDNDPDVFRSDIIAKLPQPTLVGGTARATSTFRFNVDISMYKIN